MSLQLLKLWKQFKEIIFIKNTVINVLFYLRTNKHLITYTLIIVLKITCLRTYFKNNGLGITKIISHFTILNVKIKDQFWKPHSKSNLNLYLKKLNLLTNWVNTTSEPFLKLYRKAVWKTISLATFVMPYFVIIQRCVSYNITIVKKESENQNTG